MTSEQFEEWKVFETLEPFGPERADQRTAHIVAAIINAISRPKEPVTLQQSSILFGEDAADHKAEQDKAKKAPTRMDWREMQRVMIQHKDGA